MQTAHYFYFAIALFVLAAAGIWKLADRHRANSSDDAQRNHDRLLKKAVEAGTHDGQGRPLCRVDGCNDLATHPPFKAAREEGFIAWCKAQIGAAVRWTVIQDVFSERPGYCGAHVEVARFDFRSFLLEFESGRLHQIRDNEVVLARFEKEGIDERVNAKVRAHDKEAKRGEPHFRESGAGKVVNLHR